MGSTGPRTFRLVWGDFSHGITQEIVQAFDVNEALVVAHERRPELERPRTAFIIDDIH